MGVGLVNDYTFYGPTMDTSLTGLIIPASFTAVTMTSSAPEDPLDQLAAYGWMRAYGRWSREGDPDGK